MLHERVIQIVKEAAVVCAVSATAIAPVAPPTSTAKANAVFQTPAAGTGDQAKPAPDKQKKKKKKKKRAKQPSQPPVRQQTFNSPQSAPKGGGDEMPVAGLIGVTAVVAAMSRVKAGSAIVGVNGAVWADRDDDGVVDGYISNGQYYSGAPAGYHLKLPDNGLDRNASDRAATAAIGGVEAIPGAVVGASVPGLAGALWADRDNDGVVDGYVFNGQYYSGSPTGTPAASYPATQSDDTRGERG